MVQCATSLLQSFVTEVHRLPILARQHRQFNCFAGPLSQQLIDRDEVAQRLGHLLALDLEEAVVHPHVGHRGGAVRAARLRDLVLVVGKDEVDAAAVDVEDVRPGQPRRRELRQRRVP